MQEKMKDLGYEIADPKIIKRVVKNIEEISVYFNHFMSFFKEYMSKENLTLYDIMNYKKILLVNISTILPLSHNECYFCLKHENLFTTKCEKCLYKKRNGKCLGNKSSSYNKVSDAKRNLINTINDEYGLKPPRKRTKNKI